MNIHRLLAKQLRKVADDIESGSTNLTEDDAMEMLSTVCNVSISKSEVASMLNTCPSNVDKLVLKKKLAPPHKRKGITEKMWYYKDVLMTLWKKTRYI